MFSWRNKQNINTFRMKKCILSVAMFFLFFFFFFFFVVVVVVVVFLFFLLLVFAENSGKNRDTLVCISA